MDLTDSGLPTSIVVGIATFLAITSAFNTWFSSRKTDSEKIEYWKARAVDAEQKAEEEEAASRRDRERLNQLILDMASLKSENAVMLEQLTQLRLTNAALNERLEQFMRTQNAGS